MTSQLEEPSSHRFARFASHWTVFAFLSHFSSSTLLSDRVAAESSAVTLPRSRSEDDVDDDGQADGGTVIKNFCR